MYNLSTLINQDRAVAWSRDLAELESALPRLKRIYGELKLITAMQDHNQKGIFAPAEPNTKTFVLITTQGEE